MSRTVKIPVPGGVAASVTYEFDTDERVIVLAVDEGAEWELADALIEIARELNA